MKMDKCTKDSKGIVMACYSLENEIQRMRGFTGVVTYNSYVPRSPLNYEICPHCGVKLI